MSEDFRIRNRVLANCTLILAVGASACNDGRATADGDAAVTDDTSVDVSDAGSGEDVEEDRILLDTGTLNCPGEDDLSYNHDPAQATPVVGGLERDDLFVCPGYDDWFLIEGRAGRTINATIAFSHAAGDLDLYLLPVGAASADQALAQAATEADTESLAYTPPVDGQLVLWVDGFEDAGGAYELELRLGCAADAECSAGQRCDLLAGGCVEDLEPLCGNDPGEPNNRLDESEVLEAVEGTQRVAARFVCEDDDDWFAIDLPQPATLALQLVHDVGQDLNVLVFNAGGVLEGAGVTSSEPNVEDLRARFLGAGRHYIAVDDAVTGLGLDVGYDLTLDLAWGACATNADCGQVAGRQICEDGGCVPFTPSTPGGLGGACDDAADCSSGLICLQANPGFDDNFCTSECGGDADCADLEDGYCLQTGRTAYCFSACSSDADCPTLFSCDVGTGRCDLTECFSDADCASGSICRRSDNFDSGFCTENRAGTCEDDDAYEPNGSDSSAVAIGDEVDDAVICNADDDWYRFTVGESGTRVDVTVDFEAGVDLDVYLYDLIGRGVGSATSPDSVPEVATGRYLAAGEYLLRVNQAPSDVPDRRTPYTIAIATRADGCGDNSDCLSLEPLRISCGEAGACAFLEGSGTVELGGFCDSSNDCAEPAEFCWTFESATSGRNICTTSCGGASDCAAIPGTTCEEFGRGFSACLPN